MLTITPCGMQSICEHFYFYHIFCLFQGFKFLKRYNLQVICKSFVTGSVVEYQGMEKLFLNWNQAHKIIGSGVSLRLTDAKVKRESGC